MASNGNLPSSMLTSVPPGRLEKHAAAAWNAGPAKAGCRLGGPNSGYRQCQPGSQYGTQQWFWDHQPPLAARPCTTNHGLGRAVDLAEPWMRTWIDKHGAKYGLRKTEAFSEWWHVNYVGGFSPPPSPLRFVRGKKRQHADKLLYHRRRVNEEAKTGKGPRYKKQVKWRNHYRQLVAQDYRKSKGREARVLKKVLKDRDGRL